MERVVFGAILVLVTLPMLVLTLVVLFGGIQVLSERHPWLLVAAAAVAVVASVTLARRRLRPGRLPDTGALHPGITMHRIPIAGGVGLLFVLGYVFMFWQGAPAFRPLVIALPLLGAAAAGLYIWVSERWR